ncbi:MAG: LuxR C-terminal-related transcriptional regulator [Nitratireductor sp.]
MSKSKDALTQASIDRDMIVDRIYEIALEPSLIEDFIDHWYDSDLAGQLADCEDLGAGEFDKSYQSHLERAQKILQRAEMVRPDLKEHLDPYENLAAFIVSGSLLIEASNVGALNGFNAKAGDDLNQLKIPIDMRAALVRTVQDVLYKTQHTEKLIKVDLKEKSGVMLFRVMRIKQTLDEGPMALVVTTKFHWQETINKLLEGAFQLTKAEQQVVRLLVEGEDIKAISGKRNTGEGTVRSQIKSISAKMNVRSQTDIVRLVLTLTELPKGSSKLKVTSQKDIAGVSNSWLEAEVWKPFKTIILPDGRSQNYHDMGPINGNPILFSHMGSAMVRWPSTLIRIALEHNLRIICPIRAGYGYSDSVPAKTNPFEICYNDTKFLLDSLGIKRLPYAVQGTDFPLAVDFISKSPDMISELISVGGKPCLPGGLNIDGAGRWQKFFVSTARSAPHLVLFAAKAVMAMSKRIGPEAMLRQLCKDSAADMATLENEEMKQILVANISLMAGKSVNAAQAFAIEYVAFQEDWSERVMSTRNLPVKVFLAEEDPTTDLSGLPKLKENYPWIDFEVLPNAGLALIFQKADKIIPYMAKAAKQTAQ